MNIASPPRVAFFTDSYHEVNGVARTSKKFAQFALEHGYPMFSVHPGSETKRWQDGSLDNFELRDSRFSMRLETDLSFDWLFIRHRRPLLQALLEFRPNLVHITGPGHCGYLGAILAKNLRVPLVASWHTNVHEFGTRRLRRVLRYLPWSLTDAICDWTERRSLDLLLTFYRLAKLHFAPNPELISLLENATHRPCYMMRRGIDTDLFSPEKRTRKDKEFVIGYVGRVSPEKDVRILARLERKLIHAGMRNYRFLIVGDGSDRPYLTDHMHQATLPGILLGEELAQAYANMDLFVFPSETDTFGNVILEALSSGLPSIVSSGGGPQYIIDDRVNGYRTSNIDEMTNSVMQLYRDRERLQQMSVAAREKAFKYSWSSVFEGVYRHYQDALIPSRAPVAAPGPLLTKITA